jgi:hypothetical protein
MGKGKRLKLGRGYVGASTVDKPVEDKLGKAAPSSGANRSERVKCNGCIPWTGDCNGHVFSMDLHRTSDNVQLFHDGEEVLHASTWEIQAMVRMFLAHYYFDTVITDEMIADRLTAKYREGLRDGAGHSPALVEGVL